MIDLVKKINRHIFIKYVDDINNRDNVRKIDVYGLEDALYDVYAIEEGELISVISGPKSMCISGSLRYAGNKTEELYITPHKTGAD